MPVERTTNLSKGTPITGKQREELRADLKKKYDAGTSIRALAEETGRSYGFIHGILSDADATFRSRGYANRSGPKLVEGIRRDVLSGDLSPGAPVPSARKLARKYDMSPRSVSRVLPTLQSERLIEPANGAGGLPYPSGITSWEKLYRLSCPTSWLRPPTTAHVK